MFLPFKPIKGQAFRLYLDTTQSNFNSEPYADYTEVYISKDGGTFAEATNSIVQIDPADALFTDHRSYIELTSNETDADFLWIIASDQSTYYRYGDIFIYTQEEELSSVPSKTSSISEKITAIFQYLFFKRTVTASAETLYKDDENTELGSNIISDDDTTVTKGKIS